jgi:hypothetical protein
MMSIFSASLVMSIFSASLMMSIFSASLMMSIFSEMKITPQVCRGHFRLFYHDARLQAEIAQVGAPACVK